MHMYILSRFLVLFFIFVHGSALPWTQGYLKYSKNNFIYLSPSEFWNNGLNREPNCNELRAMWRFSMAKSRGTEITNEIPTYKDPFAYNVWEPQVRSKNLPNRPSEGKDYGGSQNHIYGKVVHTVPAGKYSEKLKVNGRSFDTMTKLFTLEKPITPRRKNAEAYRLPNGEVSFRKLPALTDSFRKLKAVVRAQRAKELKDQHMADSHGIVKDVKNGNAHNSPSFEYFYKGNISSSGKRNAIFKTFHYIPNPAFVYGYPKYYDQAVADYYVSDHGLYYRPHVAPMKMKYKTMPDNTPSRK